MKNYNLTIAGYNIGFESKSDGPDLLPSERFLKYLNPVNVSDIRISVHAGSFDLPEDAERIFHAPFVEEINGILLHHKLNFWSVWKQESNLFIKTIFPLTPREKNAVLKFSLVSREWDLWIDGTETIIDPFEYPLDGLVLYYLTVIYGDIMIHGSGVIHAGRGYLFSGVSGKGKSTIANLWNTYGAKVIHDDRLILRKTVKGYWMYNTPVYKNDEPRESIINKIYIIEHGSENMLVSLKGANAVTQVLANCIQHNWGADIIARLLGSISIMCGTIPTSKLFFKPDKSVIDLILENE